MIQFMQYCPSGQSSLGEAGLVLVVRCETSFGNFFTVESNSHVPYTIVLCQEVSGFLAALKLVD
jgi:hypothetical protein